jgi:hypothetical protein
MTDRGLAAFVRRRALPRLLAGLLCLGLPCLAVVAPAPAADAVTLARSDQPQTISGDGDQELIVDGPFGLAWQTAGGRFSIRAAAEGEAQQGGSGATVLLGPVDKATAAASTEGKGQGRLKLDGQQRYRVSIAASGPWTLTVTW